MLHIKAMPKDPIHIEAIENKDGDNDHSTKTHHVVAKLFLVHKNSLVNHHIYLIQG